MHAEELRRRAIAAVAKLTIFAGAAGCGNVVVDPGDSGPDEPAEIDPGEAKPAQPPDIDIDPPPAACDAATVTAVCCNTVLTQSFSDDHLFTDPTAATDQEKACCELAVTTMDTWDWSAEPPFNGSIASSCCQTGLVQGGWEQHPSCTPWGPPMPPRMPRRLLREAVMA